MAHTENEGEGNGNIYIYIPIAAERAEKEKVKQTHTHARAHTLLLSREARFDYREKECLKVKKAKRQSTQMFVSNRDQDTPSQQIISLVTVRQSAPLRCTRSSALSVRTIEYVSTQCLSAIKFLVEQSADHKFFRVQSLLTRFRSSGPGV